MRPAPTLNLELEAAQRMGVTIVAGLDEAGRGALAGPVYAAAVALPLDNFQILAILAGVQDSKILTAAQRERLFPIICAAAISFGVGHSSAREIDDIGIVPATRLAMETALRQLSPPAQMGLVDGTIRLKSISQPQQQVIRGDSLSLSIAAASILAKVSRDRYMRNLELVYPAYQFPRHKGYGTALHLAAIEQYGPCPEHRLSFAPFRVRPEYD